MPVQVAGLTSGVLSVDGGALYTCAVLSNGTVQCWGNNEKGQLGNNTTINSSVPVQVSGLTSAVTSIALGDHHTCALLVTGMVQCWGADTFSKLGDGGTATRTTASPTLFQGTAIAAAPDRTCVRASSGLVSCVGQDRRFFSTPQPTLVTGGATAIASGLVHTCAVVSGAATCWGQNDYGQLGNGMYDDAAGPVQVSMLTSNVTAVAAGSRHSCAVVSNGVQCWGDNHAGQLGNGVNFGTSPYAVQVSGLTSGATAVAVGDTHSCALQNGGVKCWGSNSVGQLGNKSNKDSSVPVQVYGLSSGVIAIAAKDGSTCAVLSSGALKCWGGNGNGELGDGTQTNRSSPVQTFSSGVTAVAAGYDHMCAVVSGAARCWGSNGYGQLGDGTSTNRTSPVQVSGLTSGVSAMSAGTRHTCARLSDNTLRCWGQGAEGALGTGTVQSSSTPVQVSGLTGVSAIAAAGDPSAPIYDDTCAITATGAIQCWGYDRRGQLGRTPVAPPTVADQALSNGALVTSQASVLVRKFANASGTVTGHVTPIAYSMVNNTTGNQALMVTYDPLAAAAAMFIEQYQAHVDACNRTTSESITEAQEQAGTYLWACSNANAKSAYLSGMQQLLLGARTYLFGRTDGSATAPCSGATSPSYCIDTTQAHMPYTFIVPNYTEAAFNPEYYGQLDTALGNYRTALFASNASGLHKSLQLAGIATFDTDSAAIVTTRVNRSGAFGAACVTP